MKGQGILTKIARSTGLPEDLLRDLPCLRMEGSGRMIVENHKGISIFTDTQLRFRTSLGTVNVTGSGFVLEGIGNEGLVLTGNIEGIEFKKV